MAAAAAISTPLGLSFLLVVPLSFSALRLKKRETFALTILCIVSRLLFGPVGDPLGLREVTLEVSEGVQLWVSTVTTVLTYTGVALTFGRIAQQKRRIGDLTGLATRDPLTRCANRRALDEFLERHEEAQGSVIVIDADHFKRVNDTYGHDAGDRVLVKLGSILSGLTRAGDLVARVGGEEFVVLLPGAPGSAAERVCTRILETIRTTPFDIGGERTIAVTASAGVATGVLGAVLLARADAALYEAKGAGRDRFATASDEA